MKRYLDYLKRKYKLYKIRRYLASKNVCLKNKKITILGNPKIKIDDSSKIILGDHIYLFDCDIVLKHRSSLILSDEVSIKGTKITLTNNSSLKADKNVIFEQLETHPQNIHLNNSNVFIGEKTRIRASISGKYASHLDIGQRTYINQGSEIRCHNDITIGNYVLISYEVNIFDNNTHSTNWQERRNSILTSPVGSFVEKTRPKSKPIVIGNDCWIGKRAAILKGVTLGDRSIVALGAILTTAVPEDCLVYGNPATWKKIQLPNSSDDNESCIPKNY